MRSIFEQLPLKIRATDQSSALRRARGHIAMAFLRGVPITADAIKRKAASRCDMSCAPYTA
jgi:hypothetical protein